MIGFPSAAGSSSGWSSVRARSTRSPPSSTTPCCSSTSPGVGTRSTSTRSSNSPRTTATPRPPVPRTSSRPRSPTIYSTGKRCASCTRWSRRCCGPRTGMSVRRAWWTATAAMPNVRATGPRQCSSASRTHRVATSSWNVRRAWRGTRRCSLAGDRVVETDTWSASSAPTRHDPRMTIDVVAPDRPGLLARVARVLSDAGLEIDHAIVATWPDGSALESFLVTATEPPPSDVLRDAIAAVSAAPLVAEPVVGVQVDFDDAASPWYTVCRVEADDQPGLLECDRRCARRRRGRRPLRRVRADRRHRDRSLRGDRGAGQALHRRTGGDRRQPPVRLRAARSAPRFGGFWDRLRATWTSDAGQHPDMDSSSS